MSFGLLIALHDAERATGSAALPTGREHGALPRRAKRAMQIRTVTLRFVNVYLGEWCRSTGRPRTGNAMCTPFARSVIVRSRRTFASCFTEPRLCAHAGHQVPRSPAETTRPPVV